MRGVTAVLCMLCVLRGLCPAMLARWPSHCPPTVGLPLAALSSVRCPVHRAHRPTRTPQVHAPYVGYEQREALGLPLQIPEDADNPFFSSDAAYVTSCGSCCAHCCCSCVFGCCLPCCPGITDEATHKECEQAAPGFTAVQHRDYARSYAGARSYGFLLNSVGSQVSKARACGEPVWPGGGEGGRRRVRGSLNHTQAFAW